MNYINDLDKGKKLLHFWWGVQAFFSLWYIWLGILLFLAIMYWLASSIINTLSHPEAIGSWFGKLIAGFKQASQ